MEGVAPRLAVAHRLAIARRPCGVGEPDPGGRRSRGGPVRRIRAGETSGSRSRAGGGVGDARRRVGEAGEASPSIPASPSEGRALGEDLRCCRRRRGRKGEEDGRGEDAPPGMRKRNLTRVGLVALIYRGLSHACTVWAWA